MQKEQHTVCYNKWPTMTTNDNKCKQIAKRQKTQIDREEYGNVMCFALKALPEIATRMQHLQTQHQQISVRQTDCN